MPIETICSSCRTSYTLPDSKRGKSVRCGECGESFVVEEVEERSSRGKKKAGASAVATVARGGGEDTEEETGEAKQGPRRVKKKPKKKGAPLGLILGGVAVGLLVLGGGGGWLGYYLYKKTRDQAPPTPSPIVHGGGGGGGGGAAQGVRMAATRTVTLADLHNLGIFINNAIGPNGEIPSAQDIITAMERDAGSRQTHMLLLKAPDGGRPAITLTGTRSRENIWAYSTNPQSVAGERLVLTSNGIDRIASALLRQRLQQQGSPVPEP